MLRPCDEAMEMLKAITDADSRLEACLFLRLAGFESLPPFHDAFVGSDGFVVMAVNNKSVSYWDAGKKTPLTSRFGCIHEDLQKWL